MSAFSVITYQMRQRLADYRGREITIMFTCCAKLTQIYASFLPHHAIILEIYMFAYVRHMYVGPICQAAYRPLGPTHMWNFRKSLLKIGIF